MRKWRTSRAAVAAAMVALAARARAMARSRPTSVQVGAARHCLQHARSRASTQLCRVCRHSAETTAHPDHITLCRGALSCVLSGSCVRGYAFPPLPSFSDCGSFSGCTPCCCALPPDPGTTIIFTISGHKKKKDKLLTMDESEITYEMVSRKLREIITSRGRKGTDKLEQVRA